MPEDPQIDRLIEVYDVTDGMQTSVSRSKRSPGSLILGENLRMEGDDFWIGRREGTTKLGDPPDTNAVLLLMYLIDEGGNVNILRITKSSIYLSYGDDNWFSISSPASGNSPPYSGTFFLGNVYLVNGKDKVLEINMISKTAAFLTESPYGATHIENFGDRLVVARGSELIWCANLVPADWSSESAGSENLVQGAGELANTITGLHATGDVLVILRRNSIWHGSRQPFAENPFRFDRIVSGLGCDLPYSSAKVPTGVIYADGSTGSVYAYFLGSLPQKISSVVHNRMLKEARYTRAIRGTYVPSQGCYVLGTPSTAGNSYISRLWKFYYKHNAWIYDNHTNVTALASVYTENVTFIDDLTGYIDGLAGVIDDLSGSKTPKMQKIGMGLSTGEVVYYDESEDTDWDDSEFIGTLQSQDFSVLARTSTVKILGWDFDVQRAGTAYGELSTDGSSWKGTKEFDLLVGNQRLLLKQTLSTEDHLYWRLRLASGDLRMTGWWAKVMDRSIR